MSAKRTLDVSHLPSEVLDSRSMVWWGTLVMSLIEGLVFALAVGAYFYLRMLSNEWPPARTGAPKLTIPTINLVILLVSVVPAIWLDRAGRRRDVRMIRIGLGANLVLGTAFLVLRAFELKSLNCWWNTHAYGSITWTILGLHTSNLLTSLLESAIILAWFLFRKPDAHHFLDARLDGVFWYFVVATWVPLYVVVFLVPRF
ncbi:MAG TPA: cytochrome c oxidase subunit 3 [Thermoanaerobaculia bacterium]